MNTNLGGTVLRGLGAWLACASLCVAQDASKGGGATPPIPTPANPAPQAQDASKGDPKAGSAQEAPKFMRYLRAGANGAKVRNIYDDQGVVILDAPAQTLFAVQGERAHWLEVEVPGGFSVWVYGQYVAPTGTPGVLQITGSEVRMRPLPSQGPESLALRQLLGAGQKVLFKARKDLSKPLGEDWVNVWSPPGTRAWVKDTELEALPAGGDGAALWAAACAEARKATASAVTVDDPKLAGAKPDDAKADSKDVNKALAEAEKLLAEQRTRDEQGLKPDYSAARKAFEGVLVLGPSAATAELVRGRVELCKGYEEGNALRANLEQSRKEIDAALKKRQEEMDRAAKRGVFEGRFDVRGRLERVELPTEAHAIYMLRWAGEANAELVCTSGRFDLADYVGCEIGVVGRELRGVIRGTTPALTRPREIDLARIEVLSSSQGAK